MRIIALLVSLLVLVACSGRDRTLVPVDSAIVATLPPAPPAPTVVTLQPEAPPRCEPGMEIFDLESLKQALVHLRNCDPFKEYFTIEGRIRMDNWPGEHPSSTFLGNLQMLAYPLRHLKQAFENLSIPDRRQILIPAMKLVAPAVVGYVHRSYLEDYLLKLDWAKDVASVDPVWYGATSWPADRFQRVSVSMPDGEGSKLVSPERKLSKVDLWVRMFWLRRGELVFNTAKEAVREALPKKQDTTSNSQPFTIQPKSPG